MPVDIQAAQRRTPDRPQNQRRTKVTSITRCLMIFLAASMLFAISCTTQQGDEEQARTDDLKTAARLETSALREGASESCKSIAHTNRWSIEVWWSVEVCALSEKQREMEDRTASLEARISALEVGP